MKKIKLKFDLKAGYIGKMGEKNVKKWEIHEKKWEKNVKNR